MVVPASLLVIVTSSHCVHLKLGHQFLLKVCSGRDDIVPLMWFFVAYYETLVISPESLPKKVQMLFSKVRPQLLHLRRRASIRNTISNLVDHQINQLSRNQRVVIMLHLFLLKRPLSSISRQTKQQTYYVYMSSFCIGIEYCYVLFKRKHSPKTGPISCCIWKKGKWEYIRLK